MFRALIWCLVLIIYLGALFTVVAFTFAAPTIIDSIGLEPANSFITYSIGMLVGVIAASVIFGIPIVLLNINANLERAVALLEAIEQPPDLLTAVAPVLVDHALGSLDDA